MAQIADMTGLEARLTRLGSQVEHLAQILQRVPEIASKKSTLDDWQDELNGFTADIKRAGTQLSSFRQRWHDATIVKSEDVTRLERREEEIKMKEELLEQKAAEITRREELLKQKTADITKGQELLEQKAAEMTKREELLEQMVAEMTKRGELLDQKTRAINEREETTRRTEETVGHACERLGRHQQGFQQLMTALRSGVSLPALNPIPATRQDLTVNPVSSGRDTLVPAGQGGGSTTDPSDLLVASDHVRNVWRQIEFPADWTTADSATLLDKFNEAKERKGGKNNRYWPQQAMDVGSKFTQPYCLLKDLKKMGMQAPQDGRRCASHASDDLCINVFYSTESPGEYDSAATDKRWRLEKRQ